MDGGRVPVRRRDGRRDLAAACTTCRCSWSRRASAPTMSGDISEQTQPPTSLRPESNYHAENRRARTRDRCAETAAEMLHEAGYAGRRDPRALTCATSATRSSSSTCVRGTSRPTSARAHSTSASRVVTCCSTPSPRRSRSRASASANRRSASPGEPGKFTRAQRPRGHPCRDKLPGARSVASSRATASRRSRAARRRRRVGGAPRRRGCRRRRRLDGHDAAQRGPRDLRSGHPGVRGRADQSRSRRSRGVDSPAPPAGRARRAAVTC